MGCGQTKTAAQVWSKEDFEKYDAIKKMWVSIDLDDSGYIEIRELKLKLDKEGKHVGLQSLKLAFDLVDADHSGRISFDEFCKHNGLVITDEVKKHLDKRKAAHFDTEQDERKTDGHGHLKKHSHDPSEGVVEDGKVEEPEKKEAEAAQ
mmetsp:Transcript_36480/g.74885  ORF Transcript_36480/g.74885 Transcript_36480/m.74885 type:complete len:149 (+) Transcript_36480:267-713(+)|eukprot:CAMPEP_0181346630 /NCGR_PEP_ID=MMETSP1101-20121128/33430_1 /TAXON_ID=46948 /ORGANISM="Rhodomonas abbreviata, Strain Caron Lab Isolate" /LENGTH=148 /DNA_ID=CAMNT_0023458755 /DNA_START=248 /DNA_END=694 /DNA_ORIENTATION=-